MAEPALAERRARAATAAPEHFEETKMNDRHDQLDDPKALLTTGDGEREGAGAKGDLEGGTTGAASMTGGDKDRPAIGMGGANDASPGGRESPAGEALGPIGTSSHTPGPMGESGGGASLGPASNGSFASGTYNERGDVTGPDSPAGPDAAGQRPGEGQGDDLANRLGGGDNARTGLTGAGAASGDMGADRSERSDASALNAAGAGGPSAGDVGGMGGVRGHTGGSSRPPGGVSPIQPSRDEA
jgi:hypothetical protein